MSKQEHDQDEPRSPSGGGKDPAAGGSPPSGDTSATPGKGKTERASSDRGRDQAAASSTKPASTNASAAGKTNNAKSASNGKAAADKAAGGKSSGSPQGAKQTSPKGESDKTAGNGKAAPPPTGNSGAARPSGGGGGGKAGGVALVLVVLLAIGVGIGGWWGWQQLQRQQQRLSALDQVSQNRQRLDDLSSQLEQRDSQRGQAVQAIRDDFQQYRQEMNATLDKVLAQLASKQQTDASEWRVAEVEYLLGLANQRLQLERDVKGAVSLLQTADQRLAKLDNPALTPVRRAIQSELGELNSVPQIDRTGVYLTLMALQEQLAKLPLEQDIQQQAAQAGDTSPMKGGWQQQLARFGQELKDLVVVRKHDQALEALITPQQESYLRQNVRLQLEQAQLALLQSDPQLYRASLDKARSLIQGYYDTGNQGVSSALDQLGSLGDKTIRPDLPDISASLQKLRDFMERRHDAGSGAA
ncbi:uroporphyrinogen-III C-methyltransferase [Modicisalibacter tunisiensis]|uniref:uroporphyrinogen-III C-methyltransferase n=1 Tax=Modicisalibacter tunisiensis TaxID=390637 RepID=UPI001CCFAAE9|nr:uroporphyrinogen-III C-methyltransferase [Modicisalibacter tunisiensis]MBZ9539912.1 uroporphyrinogen-III C-methyltransferase [Modicisalibacter tunisiensis]